jgi:hypothetical protein
MEKFTDGEKKLNYRMERKGILCKGKYKTKAIREKKALQFPLIFG